MSYKTIMSYADAYAPWTDRVSLCVDLARMFDAHLTVASLGYDPEVPPTPYPEGFDMAYSEMIKQVRKEAEVRAAAVSGHVSKEDVRIDVVPFASTYSSIGRRFARVARFADLAVFDAPYETADVRSCHEIFEGTLFGADTPALVCPPGTRTIEARTVLIAWNDSRESLRAIRGALPFLRQAEEIEIAVVGPRERGMAPAEELAVMLARQGAGTEITSLSKNGDAVPDLLRQRVSDLGAGLLVMGGYGHSRFREYLIGGVTRNIVSDPPAPLITAH